MKFLCQFGLNPPSGSGDIVQTKSYTADADDADGIHTKNNMSPTPSEGGHNEPHNRSCAYAKTWTRISCAVTEQLITEAEAEQPKAGFLASWLKCSWFCPIDHS